MASPVRAVLVGCGGMSRSWTRVSKESNQIELVGFVDINEAAARARAEDYGVAGPTGTDLDKMLDAVTPDAVFDCTIPEVHTPVALQAFSHGCHVLSEKPMSDSMENAYKAARAASTADRIYAIIQNRRYDSNIRRLSRTLRDRTIGDLTTLNCDFYIGAHFEGFRNHMPHVLLLDMAIHTFDAARLITGADPVSVYCKEWNPAGSWYDRDASAVAIFEMTGGIVYTYRGSWCSEGLNTTWECDWRIIGEKGSITWNGADEFQGHKVVKTEAFLSDFEEFQVAAPDTADRIGGHQGLILDFVDCIQNGGTPETSYTDNIKSLAMAFGAIESAEAGKAVSIQVQGS
ncbi:MAG: Gfo/Idh/MocA family oxidoreductase [Candidatus Latescibacterota bacterium]|nr:Gfo/Idh/MocA family oxidoreductase [Candidatus Latescibacterota bacterium]